MSDEYFDGAYNEYYQYTESSTFDWTTIISTVTDNILIPVIILIASTILIVARSYAKRLTSSVVSKNEAEALEKVFATKSHIVSELSTIVEAAVASNMQMAQAMKANGHKLTEEEINKLNLSARKMIMTALPSQITDTNGSLIGVMGGKEALDSLIDSLMEKYVYEYKLKALDPSFVPNSSLSTASSRTGSSSAKAQAKAIERSVSLNFNKDYGAVQNGDNDIFIESKEKSIEDIFNGNVEVTVSSDINEARG